MFNSLLQLENVYSLNSQITIDLTTKNCKLQIQRKILVLFVYRLPTCVPRPRVPVSRIPASHVLASPSYTSLRPRVSTSRRPRVPESYVPTSPSPTSPCLRVPESHVLASLSPRVPSPTSPSHF